LDRFTQSMQYATIISHKLDNVASNHMCSVLVYLCNEGNIFPWRRMGEWMYRSTHSWPRPYLTPFTDYGNLYEFILSKYNSGHAYAQLQLHKICNKNNGSVTYHAGRYSGNVLDLYCGGIRFESLSRHYLSWLCSCFSSVPPEIYRNNISITPFLRPYKSFPIHYSSVIFLPSEAVFLRSWQR
jgi:hypothetical protein